MHFLGSYKTIIKHTPPIHSQTKQGLLVTSIVLIKNIYVMY